MDRWITYCHSPSQKPQSYFTSVLFPKSNGNHSVTPKSDVKWSSFRSGRCVSPNYSKRFSLRSQGTPGRASSFRASHVPTLFNFRPDPCYSSPVFKPRSSTTRNSHIKVIPQIVESTVFSSDTERAIRTLEARKRVLPSVFVDHSLTESADSGSDEQAGKKRRRLGSCSSGRNAFCVGDKCTTPEFKYTSIDQLKKFPTSPQAPDVSRTSPRPDGFHDKEKSRPVSSVSLNLHNQKHTPSTNCEVALRRRIPYMSPAELDALFKSKACQSVRIREPEQHSSSDDESLEFTLHRNQRSDRLDRHEKMTFTSNVPPSTTAYVNVSATYSKASGELSDNQSHAVHKVDSVARFIANLEAHGSRIPSGDPLINTSGDSNIPSPFSPVGHYLTPSDVSSRVSRIRSMLSVPTVDTAKSDQALAVVSAPLFSSATVASLKTAASVPTTSLFSNVSSSMLSVSFPTSASAVISGMSNLPCSTSTSFVFTSTTSSVTSHSHLPLATTTLQPCSEGFLASVRTTQICMAPTIVVPIVSSGIVKASSPSDFSAMSLASVTSSSLMTSSTVSPVRIPNDSVSASAISTTSVPLTSSSSVVTATFTMVTTGISKPFSFTSAPSSVPVSVGISTVSSVPSLSSAVTSTVPGILFNTNTTSSIGLFQFGSFSSPQNVVVSSAITSSTTTTSVTAASCLSTVTSSTGGFSFPKLSFVTPNSVTPTGGTPQSVDTSSIPTVTTASLLKFDTSVSAPGSVSNSGTFGLVPTLVTSAVSSVTASCKSSDSSGSTALFSFAANPTTTSFLFSANSKSTAGPTSTSFLTPTTSVPSFFSLGVKPASVSPVHSIAVTSTTSTSAGWLYTPTSGSSAWANSFSFSSPSSATSTALSSASNSLPSVASAPSSLFQFGASSIKAATTTAPANPSSLFQFGASSVSVTASAAPANPSSLFQFGSSSVTTTVSVPTNLFSFGQQVSPNFFQPAVTSSTAPISAVPVTSTVISSNIFQFGSSSTPASVANVGFNFMHSSGGSPSLPVFGSTQPSTTGFVFGLTNTGTTAQQSPSTTNLFNFGSTPPNTAGAVAAPRRRMITGRRTRRP